MILSRITINYKLKMMKRSFTLFLLLTLTFSSCDSMMKKTNSEDCSDKFDVQLIDGSAIWIYGGKIEDGYVYGNNEMGENIWIPMTQVVSITEIDCGNEK